MPGMVEIYFFHFPQSEKSSDSSNIRRSIRTRKEPERLQSRDSDRTSSDKTSSSKSEEWKYNDASSSESDEEKEKPPPSKRVGVRSRAPVIKKKVVKKKRNKYSSEDDDDDEESSEEDSDDESRRSVARRKATAVSYKEDSEEKTDSEDLLEVENEPVEPVPEEKCETIEKILSCRRGKKGGNFIMIIFFSTRCPKPLTKF